MKLDCCVETRHTQRWRLMHWQAKTKNYCDTLRFGQRLNMKSLDNKWQEIIKKPNDHNIDLCALQETTKKTKRPVLYSYNIVAYSGLDKLFNQCIKIILSSSIVIAVEDNQRQHNPEDRKKIFSMK